MHFYLWQLCLTVLSQNSIAYLEDCFVFYFSYYGYTINNPQTYDFTPQQHLTCSQICSVNRARWKKLISALLGVGWGSLEAGEGIHLKAAPSLG